MSARTPFVPACTRPASRAAHLHDQPNAIQKTNPQFSVDLSNPLHAPAKPLPIDYNALSAKTNPASANGNINRPLNTGSLLKRKNPAPQGHVQDQNASRRAALTENAPLRPGTADPRSTARQEQKQTLNRNNSFNIIAPVPRHAPRPSSPSLSNSLASGVYTASNPETMFRMPGLPTPSVPQTASDNQLQNDAHISSPTLGFSFSNPHNTSEPQKPQLPSPPTSIRAISTRPFVAADSDVPVPLLPFNVDMSIPKQFGAQRVVLNSDGTRPNQDPEADDARRAFSRTSLVPVKRSRGDLDSDSDHNPAAGNYKRYRDQDDVYSQRAKSVTAHPSSPGSHSAESRDHRRTPEVLINDFRSSYQHQLPLTPPANERVREDSYEHHNHQQQNVDESHGALDKLLGCDVDIIVEDHAEQYERAIVRWKQCTMAEWVAGADEQAARYSKILDFVKDHMTAKMKLFASFDAKVDGHNTVLNGREKTLEAVKGRLVQESGNVLGNVI
ncbi:hypothetical protein FPV67DRAFT_881494 [Lyophyllum atratum]|nr:hypothetical protein FPV67DRAFT_881494 [Lyophyllum atratum]